MKQFNFDKRRAHYSSLILTNQRTRKQAISKLNDEPMNDIDIKNEFRFVSEKLDISEEYLENLMLSENKCFKDYKSNYKYIQFFVKLLRFIGWEKRIIR